MRKLRHTLLRVFLLNKRILRQPMFIVLLMLVPVLVLAVNIISRDSSSLVTVALAPEEPDSAFTMSVIDELCSESGSAVRYYSCDSEEALTEDIASGNARLGLVLPSDLGDLFDAYASQDTADSSDSALSALSSLFGRTGDVLTDHPIICFLATNDIVSKLTREHFYGKVFRYLEAAVLKVYLRDNPQIGSFSEEDIDRYAESVMDDSASGYDYFELSYLDGDIITAEDISRYIASPMRGLLAVLLTLTALAAVLYLSDDLKRGRFVWINLSKLPLFCCGYILIPLADVGIAVYIALILSGSFTAWERELPYLALFVLCAAGFANLLRILLRRVTLIASSVPIVLCSCLFLTPVFMDLSVSQPIQILLPPYLYLKSIHGFYPGWTMAVYAAVSLAASLVLDMRIRPSYGER